MANFKKIAAAAAVLGSIISASAVAVDPTGPWFSSPNGGAPVAFGQTLVSAGGDVTLTFLGPTSASYTEHLFVDSPANGLGQFFNNHTTPNGTTVDLGVIPAGVEIKFGLFVDTTGLTFYDGPGSRNPDGQVHAYMVNNYEGLADTTYVGFEDLSGLTGSDWNYVDEVYAFTGARAVAAPDSGSTLSLLGIGMASLIGVTRRFRK